MSPDRTGAEADDLECRILVEVVTDYLEGALAPAERRRFDAHLQQCPFCAEYVAQMRSIASDLNGLRALLAAFRGWRES